MGEGVALRLPRRRAAGHLSGQQLPTRRWRRLILDLPWQMEESDLAVHQHFAIARRQARLLGKNDLTRRRAFINPTIGNSRPADSSACGDRRCGQKNGISIACQHAGTLCSSHCGPVIKSAAASARSPYSTSGSGCLCAWAWRQGLLLTRRALTAPFTRNRRNAVDASSRSFSRSDANWHQIHHCPFNIVGSSSCCIAGPRRCAQRSQTNRGGNQQRKVDLRGRAHHHQVRRVNRPGRCSELAGHGGQCPGESPEEEPAPTPGSGHRARDIRCVRIGDPALTNAGTGEIYVLRRHQRAAQPAKLTIPGNRGQASF